AGGLRRARRPVHGLEERLPRRAQRLWAHLLQRPARAVHRPRPGRAGLPLRRRAAGRRGTRRHLRVPRADRGVHLVLVAVRGRPRVLPGRVHGAAAALRAGHGVAPARPGRPAVAAVGRLPGAGAVRAAQLGPARRRGRHRGTVVLAARPRRPGGGAVRARGLPQDLSRAVPAAAGGRAPRAPGPRRGAAAAGGRGADRARRQPAVRPAGPAGVGRDLRLPVGPGGRQQQQQHLVLDLPPPEHRRAQPAGARPGRARRGRRRGVRRGARPAGGRLPAGAGLRRRSDRLPAGQQGRLAAVHAVAAPLLRPAAGPLGLVGGLPGRRRPGVRRRLPLARRPAVRRRPHAARAGAGRGRVVEVRAAGPALPAAPAGGRRRASARPV
ncbi:MAG: hypothetical protein AVDCRST_MAG16-1840, partial [uncultured Frankineae bacterium]